jgi:hypothetical protein
MTDVRIAATGLATLSSETIPAPSILIAATGFATLSQYETDPTPIKFASIGFAVLSLGSTATPRPVTFAIT